MKKYYKIIPYTLFILIGIYYIYKFFIFNPYYSISDFGLNYNEFRKDNNIPLLPSDWVIDSIGKYGIANFHSRSMEQIGHRIKYLNLLKSDLGAEMDEFYLGKDSIITSRYERNTGNKLLFIQFYLAPDGERQINNIEANNLLEKHNIDFRFNNSWSVSFENSK